MIIVISVSFTLGFIVGKNLPGRKTSVLKQKKTEITEQDKTLMSLRIPEDKITSKVSGKPENMNRKAEYFIQVSALRNPSDARRMQIKLKKEGYKSTIIKDKTDNKGILYLYKVRIGSYETKKKALSVLSEIRGKGLEGFIVRGDKQ